MRTNILTKLHERSINELALIAECDRRRYEISKQIEAEEKKPVNTSYLLTPKSEYQRQYQQLLETKQRLFAWYWQTLNKIMYYSNK